MKTTAYATETEQSVKVGTILYLSLATATQSVYRNLGAVLQSRNIPKIQNLF